MKVCSRMGITVSVIKLKLFWMMGFTVPVEKETICPTTPITDCKIPVSPSKAAPASGPNIWRMFSRRGARAFATPPSPNRPEMNPPTSWSFPVKLSNTARPLSPKMFPTIPRISSRWSPSILTIAITAEIAPIIGTTPVKKLPKPAAIGPQTLPRSPAPALAKLPISPSTGPAKFPTAPAAPPIAFAWGLPMMADMAPPALPATQFVLPLASPKVPLTKSVNPVAWEMPERISFATPPVPTTPLAIPPPMPVFSKLSQEPLIPPKYLPMPLLATALLGSMAALTVALILFHAASRFPMFLLVIPPKFHKDASVPVTPARAFAQRPASVIPAACCPVVIPCRKAASIPAAVVCPLSHSPFTAPSRPPDWLPPLVPVVPNKRLPAPPRSLSRTGENFIATKAAAIPFRTETTCGPLFIR